MDLSVKPVSIEELEGRNPFQSTFWAKLKETVSWSPFAFYLACDSYNGTVLVLVRKLAGLFYIAYSPFCFDSSISCADLEAFARKVRKYLPSSTILLRLDLAWNARPGSRRFRTCSSSVQPELTVRLDLTRPLAFRSRVRRNLKKEEGVTVRLWNGIEEDFSAWYDTYVQTGQRDSFSCRSRAYLRTFLSLGDEKTKPLLYLARADGKITGGIITLRTPNEEVYLFGSSSFVSKGVSCGYSLQAAAIEEAKKAGVECYDLFGIGRDGDHLSSLTVFKTGFNGDVVQRPATADYLYISPAARLFRFADSLRFRHAREKRG